MNPNSNRYNILFCLYPGEEIINYSLSGPELRILSGLKPLKFRDEIRALINLRWVDSSGYRYRITEAGKAALEASKKVIKEGESQELFK